VRDQVVVSITWLRLLTLPPSHIASYGHDSPKRRVNKGSGAERFQFEVVTSVDYLIWLRTFVVKPHEYWKSEVGLASTANTVGKMIANFVVHSCCNGLVRTWRTFEGSTLQSAENK